MGRVMIILLLLYISTCILEFIPLLFFKNGLKWIKASLFCNVITNPIMNGILALVLLMDFNQTVFIAIVILLEIAVILFEAFLYYNMLDEAFKKCLLVSLIANLFSVLAGFLVFEMFEITAAPPARAPIDPALLN